MAKKASGLSSRFVATIKEPGMYADGGNLYLQVTPTGAKTWVFRFKLNGRRRDMGLGSAATLSLAEARDKASGAKKMVSDGIDPIDAKKASAAAESPPTQATTFRQAAEAYIAVNKAGWRNEVHAAQWPATLEAYAYPVFGDTPVSDVDTEMVLRAIEPIWSEKSETANRVRGRIEMILDYAKVKGMREGENPARWKGHLSHILPSTRSVATVRHHLSMPYTQVPAFWPKLQAQNGTSARALEFTILTAVRTNETLGARWAEFDLENKVWVIPAERMKAGNEHRVPLTDQAMAILKKMLAIKGNDVVFPGPKMAQMSDMSMMMVLRRMKANATTHGFRSTFRTWVAEKTNHADAVAESALAHTVGDKVVAAYQRGDLFEKRRALMEDWACYVESAPITAPAYSEIAGRPAGRT